MILVLGEWVGENMESRYVNNKYLILFTWHGCCLLTVLTLLTSSTFCSNSAKLFLTASRRRNPLVSGLASTWHTAHNTNVWVSHVSAQSQSPVAAASPEQAWWSPGAGCTCLPHSPELSPTPLAQSPENNIHEQILSIKYKTFLYGSMFVNNIELFELIFISRKVRTHSWYWTLFWWSSFIVVSSLILLKDLIIFGKASTFYHRIKLVAESLNWALRLLMKAWVFLSSGFKIKHFSLKQINLIVSISKM